MRNLLLEPYRIFFFVGVLMAILMLAHWFVVLVQMQAGNGYAGVTRSVYQVHAQEMYYCIFAYFAFGFVLTAFPRFIEMPHPDAALVLFWVSVLLLSEVALVAGLLWPVCFYASAGLQLLAYSTLLGFLVRSCCRSKATWREQPLLIIIGFCLGLVGSLIGNLALINTNWLKLRNLSIQTGLYGFILFLIFSITWRVVPFFSSRVLVGYEIKRGRYSGRLILALILARLICFAFERPHLCWAFDGLILITYTAEIVRWQPWRARSFPPLFILYLGLFWLLVFLAFSPLRLVAYFMDPDVERFFSLHEKNILHVFNLGTFGTLILAVSSRVTRGHGGLPLRFDVWMGLALFFMQLAMLVRVLNIHETMHYAALLWVGAFSIWAWRHFPILLQAPVGKES